MINQNGKNIVRRKTNNGCDFEGWQNVIVKQMNISKLPYNILVTKNRKIITSCIYGDELVQKVKDLIQENKKKK